MSTAASATAAAATAQPSNASPGTSQRVNLADFYRPVGPKLISTQNWASGGGFLLSQTVDLSLPIRGLRFVFTGRLVIAGGNMASETPEFFLNLISGIVVQGTNARQKGNVTLWNIDLATLYGISHLVSAKRAAYYSINNQTGGEIEVSEPNTPWPTDNVPNTAGTFGANGTYDWRIVVDLPFHPLAANVMGTHPHWVPAYLVRNEEWKDSLQIQCSFPTVTNGAVAGPLGTGAAGTTYTFSSYGSGAGSPQVSVYSLPIVMGLNLKDGVLPGILARNNTPIASILQSAGANVTILNMQKQPTTRVFIKSGVGTAPPAMASLNDTNISALAILLGANRNVRNLLDVFAHKANAYSTYERNFIQGYAMLEFMQSGNPDAAYPGQNIGDGSTFQLNANVTGVANAQGIIIQEQSLHTPTGSLYSY